MSGAYAMTFCVIIQPQTSLGESRLSTGRGELKQVPPGIKPNSPYLTIVPALP